MQVRSGAGGRLFGAVTVTEIAGALAEASGEQVDKRTIVVTNPIKSLGSHEVVGQAARRGVGHGRPQRDPRLTHPAQRHHVVAPSDSVGRGDARSSRVQRAGTASTSACAHGRDE